MIGGFSGIVPAMKINIPAMMERLFRPGKNGAGTIPVRDMGILDHIEKIVEISRDQGIDRCLSKAKVHLEYVAGKLGISPLQSVLFSHFAEKGMDSYVDLGDIAEAVKCSKIRIIKYINDCEQLEEKKLIQCRRQSMRDSVSYRVPRKVTESLSKNNEFRPEARENLDIKEFFGQLERVFDERENDELTCKAMRGELLEFLNQNLHLLFCKKLKSYELCGDDIILFLCFCHLCYNNNDDNIGAHDIEFLYDAKTEFRMERDALSDASHTLIQTKFIEYNNSDGFVNNESWKVSDMAKKELLCELNMRSRNYKKNLILHDGIKEKRMFYNRRETKAIEKLGLLLREDSFGRIQERLDQKGLRKGFACLFSGPPGTGKTETAYQLARTTERNIMAVDISQAKSMWYGESEKRIKEVFDGYRSAIEHSRIAPILLFNEADAIIGKRKENSTSDRAVDQTENTIQNIILQEMENLSGIMIATTNLAQNLDHAFQRRFLYKIIFDKPTPESRREIWLSLLPELGTENAAELSRRFELSGGQIENVARKCEADGILDGSGLLPDTLSRYCADELQNGASKPLGFRDGIA